jgi:hypothetical protein
MKQNNEDLFKCEAVHGGGYLMGHTLVSTIPDPQRMLADKAIRLD